MELIKMQLSNREIAIAYNALKDKEKMVEEWISETTDKDMLIALEKQRKQITALSIKLMNNINRGERA